MEQLANPEAAAEAQREARREARERAKWEAQCEAERAERERERDEQRREHREENGADRNTGEGSRGHGGGVGGDDGGRGSAEAGVGSSARRWRREDMARMRARTWDEYDAAFGAWRERAARTSSFSVGTIPLPPVGHAPVAPAATEAAWHAAVKAATLRWHPDKCVAGSRSVDLWGALSLSLAAVGWLARWPPRGRM